MDNYESDYWLKDDSCGGEMTVTGVERWMVGDGVVVPANRTPAIRDLVGGTVVFRFATIRDARMSSDMPCHPTHVVGIDCHGRGEINREDIDQTVVCGMCHTIYAATPIPVPTDGVGTPMIVYRHTGVMAMVSRRR